MHSRFARAFWYVLSSLLVSAALAENAQPLTPGAPVSREIARGEDQIYSIALREHELLEVIVEQQGVDVSVRILGSNGRERSRMDHLGDFFGFERVSTIAEQPDTVRVVIHASASRKDLASRYEIRVVIRPAIPSDKDQIEAERQFAEGERLRGEGTASSVRASLDNYRAAAEIWRRLSDPLREADARNNMGEALAYLGEHLAAVTPLEDAFALRMAAGGRRERSESLTNLGYVYNRTGQRGKALEYLNTALEQQDDAQLQAVILNTLSGVYFYLGELPKALETALRALPLRRLTGDRRGEAFTLNALASYYAELGEWQKSIDHNRQALSIQRELHSKAGEAAALHGIGTAYEEWGMNERALEYFKLALALRRQVGDRAGLATTLVSIAAIYVQRNEPDAAIDALWDAFSVSQGVGPRRTAGTLNWLAATYLRIGKVDVANDFLKESLQMSRQMGDKEVESMALKLVGDIYLRSSHPENALGCYLDSLAQSVETPSQISIRQALAKTEMQLGHLNEALRHIQAALEMKEDQRTAVLSQDVRLASFASIRDMYAFQIDLLMRLHHEHLSEGFDAAAFHASERARSRSLLDFLTESRADIRRGVTPELLQHERTIQARLSSKANRMIRLKNDKHTEEEVESLTQEIQQLSADYDLVLEEIRKKSPRYAALTQPRPITVKQLQRVLGSDSVLLEYFLGGSNSYLWAVTQDAVFSYELPNRETIENAARSLYRRSSDSQVLASHAADQKAAELGKILLGPVEGLIKGKRMVVVADGGLQYIPFAILKLPHASMAIVDHEIVYAPSASALVTVRSDSISRARPPKTVAVFADPVFTSDDERVVGATRRGATAAVVRDSENGVLLDSAIRDAGISDLVRLPFTRREAMHIVSLVPAEQATAALDFEASRTNVLSEKLGDYRIIHFATHGLLDSHRPEFSGIVLSLVDQHGNQQDGFLPATEVFNLKLRAELVVLSACRTALGPEVRSEGLVGLTRGFMYAGAPRVVASLWKVNDAATAELMRNFYAAMLGPQKLRPAAALREAQLALARTPRWSAPYYWSAFVLQGEWN
jgi:CHAT domain-containing protein/tetratricopeptide (TPR) repeat protein